MEYNNEQWKSGGDCKLCRKQSYCKGDCKAHTRYTNAVFANAIANAIVLSIIDGAGLDKNKGE